MKNSNLKGGLFSRKELGLYECLREKDIDIILDYQKKLPILNLSEEKQVDARKLHDELGVNTKFSDWIKGRIKKYNFEEEVDYNKTYNIPSDFDVPKNKNVDNMNSNQLSRYGISVEYILSLDMAKELSMVENNDIGKLARKYFILIEKAFKERRQWNSERVDTIEMCKELKRPLYKMKDELEEYLPFWFKGNVYSFEFNLLNTLIMGKSATKYRIEKGLKPYQPIRNTFDKHTLDVVHKLEQYDAILLEIQNMLNWEDRKPLLSAYYCSIRKND